LTLNTLHPGTIGILENNPIFTFSPDWGSKRGATWIAGILCFYEQSFLKKLVGIGPDCMAMYIYQGGSTELSTFVNEQFASLRLTNAHNEWITVLVNLGLLGAISFIGIIITSIYRFIKKSLGGRNGIAYGILGACGISVMAYTINNMFSFQQMLNGINLFIILGIGENIMREIQAEQV
jgi:O-antigen ligase